MDYSVDLSHRHGYQQFGACCGRRLFMARLQLRTDSCVIFQATGSDYGFFDQLCRTIHLVLGFKMTRFFGSGILTDLSARPLGVANQLMGNTGLILPLSSPSNSHHRFLSISGSPAFAMWNIEQWSFDPRGPYPVRTVDTVPMYSELRVPNIPVGLKIIFHGVCHGVIDSIWRKENTDILTWLPLCR